jgi:hypothetical protein
MCNYLSAAKGGLDTPNTPPKKEARRVLQLGVAPADEKVGGLGQSVIRSLFVVTKMVFRQDSGVLLEPDGFITFSKPASQVDTINIPSNAD